MRSVFSTSTISLGAGVLMLLTLLGCGAPQGPSAPPPPNPPTNILWTEQFGSGARDEARAVASNPKGGFVVVGYTTGGLKGDSAGNADAFVRSYGADGKPVWTEQFGKVADDFGYVVATDPDGNVIVAGYTTGDLVGESAGGWDVFVRKFSPAGATVWERQFGTVMNEDLRGVATDAAGNVYLAGGTGGDLEGESEGGFDVFLQKYDADGTLGWTRQFGTSADEGARGVTTDSAGNVIVTGFTKGSLGGGGAGQSDVFVRKFTPGGVELWTHQFGTSATDSARGVVTDSEDNIIVVGYTDGAIVGALAGPSDTFVRKLSREEGNPIWTKQFGTSGNDRPGGVAVDSQDNIVVAGYTDGDLKGASAGDYDAFVFRYAPSGELLWSEQFGTNAADRARGVATDSQGNIIIVGNTTGVLMGGRFGDQDVFVRAYEP